MRIAVTGATGNVGTALLRRLTEGGGHELVGIARRPPNDEFPTVSWVSTDLTTDQSIVSLREAFRDADAVVHLAWGFQPSHDPDHLEELGVGGTRRVIDAARDVSSALGTHVLRRRVLTKVDDEPIDESYPTGGIPSSPYGRHKAAAERLLEAHEAHHEVPRVTRLRPGIIGQRAAAGALLRYGLPGFVPARAIRLIPVLPLDRRIAMPMVHADDVAAAIERVLTVSAYGAFNLAAPPTITPQVIGEVLDARPIHVPGNVLRSAEPSPGTSTCSRWTRGGSTSRCRPRSRDGSSPHGARLAPDGASGRGAERDRDGHGERGFGRDSGAPTADAQ